MSASPRTARRPAAKPWLLLWLVPWLLWSGVGEALHNHPLFSFDTATSYSLRAVLAPLSPVTHHTAATHSGLGFTAHSATTDDAFCFACQWSSSSAAHMAVAAQPLAFLSIALTALAFLSSLTFAVPRRHAIRGPPTLSPLLVS